MSCLSCGAEPAPPPSPSTCPSCGPEDPLSGGVVHGLAKRGPAVPLRVPQTECVCADVCTPSHVRMSPWALAMLGAWRLQARRCQRAACGCTGGHMCRRTHTHTHTPGAGPCSLSRLLPPLQLETWEGGGGSGRPQPCSPERWPGQGGGPRPGQSAGRGPGLRCGLRHVLPVRLVATTWDGRLAPIRKALPGEAGLLEAESASPRAHPNP